MDAALKTKLAAYAKAKRARARLLKDLSTADILILCDRAEEKTSLELRPGSRVAYLRWASKAQIEALKKRLDHATATIGSRIGPRQVTVFRQQALEESIGWAVATPRKYIISFQRTLDMMQRYRISAVTKAGESPPPDTALDANQVSALDQAADERPEILAVRIPGLPG